MVDFWRLDLNLLLVFDAVMRERNVLRVSRQLHLKQWAAKLPDGARACGVLRHSGDLAASLRATGRHAL